MRLLARRIGVVHRLGQHLAVDIGRKAHAALLVLHRVENRLRGHGAQLRQRLGARGGHPLRVLHLALGKGVIIQRAAADGAAALADALVEQALGHGRSHQRAHREGAGALAEDRHVAGIAAEPADIALHPLQRGDHVHQAVIPCRSVSFLGKIRGGQKAEHAQAVIDR